MPSSGPADTSAIRHERTHGGLSGFTTAHTELVRAALGSLLVAAAVAAATLAACTAGGSTSASTGASVSGSGSRSAVASGSAGPSRVASYRAALTRPLRLPALHRGDVCPTSGGVAIEGHGFGGVAQGGGPVHPLAGDTHGVAELISTTQERGWLAIKDLWFSVPRYQGPFLVRVRRIDHAGPAGLLEKPTLSSFYVAPGRTLNGSGGYREVPGATWVKSPGCIAWQVDGLAFSTVIVMRLVCRPSICTIPRKAAGGR
jgi:hypothetical protein